MCLRGRFLIWNAAHLVGVAAGMCSTQESGWTGVVMEDAPIGSLVLVDGVPYGAGKLVGIEGDGAVVEWLRTVGDVRREVHPLEAVKRYPGDEELRCYVSMDDGGECWRLGRLLAPAPRPSPDDLDRYWVRVAGEREGARQVRCDRILPRSRLTIADPSVALALGISDTPFFHLKRTQAMRRLVEQRSAVQGMTALISSGIELLRHQAAVVSTVLHDPVQRYLLADEVGLGKTIEAGVILRQAILDSPKTRALIAVPRVLIPQWCEELHHRFRLHASGPLSAPEEGNCSYLPRRPGVLQIVAHDHLAESPLRDDYDLVIIDEAHHIARAAHNPAESALWARVRAVCHASPRLLLLSATPALHHEADLLAMLHLLEPQTYRLEDEEGFRRRVMERQSVGRLLLRMREGLSATALEDLAYDAVGLLADDPIVQACSKRLLASLDDAESEQEQLDQIVSEMSMHVGETHRLYRRLIRTSRDRLQDQAMPPRARLSANSAVVAECYEDSRFGGLMALLDEWRHGALAAIASTGDDTATELRAGYSRLHRLMLEASSCYAPRLVSLIQWRMGDASYCPRWMQPADQSYVASVSGFPGEERLLAEMLRLASSDEEHGSVSAAAECIEHAMRTDRKCVVFAGEADMAEEIAELLRHRLKDVPIHTLTMANAATAWRTGLEFAKSHERSVFICDRAGEEGLNLQSTDRVLLADLPWDPDRVEQRLGRVDRIGHTGEMKVRVLVPVTDQDEVVSPQEAWFRLLRDGLQVFSTSIADLQFLTPGLVRSAEQAVFDDGVEAMEPIMDGLRETVEEERRLLREQAMLDSVPAVDAQRAGTVFDAMCADDEDERSLQTGVEAWLVEAWRLDARQPGEEATWGTYATGLDPVRYEVGRNTDLSERLAQEIVDVQSAEAYGTWRRDTACSQPQYALLRVGNPFVDRVAREFADDDRGRVFIVARKCEKEDAPLVCFRLECCVEADLRPVRECLVDSQLESWSLSALQRQADSWLPPWRQLLYLDMSLALVRDVDLIKALNAPYTRRRDGGTDVHLDGEMIACLHRRVDPDQWRSVCKRLGAAGRRWVERTKRFVEGTEQAATAAQDDLYRRMDQVRRGLVYQDRFRTDVAGDGPVDAAVEMESGVYQALIQGLRAPRIRLDVAGAIVLSSEYPEDW